MKQELKEAFDAVHAEQEWKDRTKTFLSRKMQQAPVRKPTRYKRFLPLAVCGLFIAMVFGGYQFYFAPVSTISIDVNPSVELSVNRLDKVVSITAYNEDGQALADALDIQFWDYADAVRQIVESDVIQGCLQRDETLSIAVAGSDKEKTGEMLLEIESCTAGQENTYCYPGHCGRNNSGPRRRASLWEIPRLFAASGSRSQHYARRGKRLSMRELRDWIAALSGETSSGISSQPGNGANRFGQGQGHGHGYGRQNGKATGLSPNT